MKRSHIVLLFILVSLMAASCNKLTNGEPVSESRNVSRFNTVSIHNNLNVRLVESNRPHVELTCPKNLIGNIITEVDGDTLFIKNENRFNWLRSTDYSIDLTIYYNALREIRFASIGDLVGTDSIRGLSEQSIDTTENGIETVWTNTFHLNIVEGCGDIDLTLNCNVLKNGFNNGTSYVTLRGKVGYSEFMARSYGSIHAERLESNFVRVQSESTNDIYVWARTGLRVWLYSIGNVYYKGSPEITVEACESDGRLIPLE